MTTTSSMPPGIYPYRWLWLAVLCAIALLQVAGLAMLARSQVQKAELRALAERSVRWEADQCPRAEFAPTANAACLLRGAAGSGDGALALASYAPRR